MTEQHVDGFLPMPARLAGEVDERVAVGKNALAYNLGFLDDTLRGIATHDLVLLGAPTGIGKTELALHIAGANAMTGRATHYFALEAEPRELERRTKYRLLAHEAHRCRLPNVERLNYTDWYFGRCEDIVGGLNRWADKKILQTLGNLHTFYRGRTFTAKDLVRHILEIADRTTLIVVDHLHYVDEGADENENRALGDTMKAIRDTVLITGRPVLLVAHMRKKDERAKKLIAGNDDFHGSSNVTKIATQTITLEPATEIAPARSYLSPTFIAATKDRRDGAKRVVALCNYDLRTKTYAPEYTLGRAKGAQWKELDEDEVPTWAAGHRPLVKSEPTKQAPLGLAARHPNAPEED